MLDFLNLSFSIWKTGIITMTIKLQAILKCSTRSLTQCKLPVWSFLHFTQRIIFFSFQETSPKYFAPYFFSLHFSESLNN